MGCKLSHSLFSAAIFSVASLSASFAADLDQPKAELRGSHNFYVAVRLGAASLDDISFDLNNAPTVDTAIHADHGDWNFHGMAAFGMDLGNNFRGELEWGKMFNDVSTHTITAVPVTIGGASAFGRTEVMTVMVNGYYDFQMQGMTPYVTAGLGAGRVGIENHGVTLPAAALGLGPGSVTAMQDSDWGMAYQVGLGTSIPLTSNADLELGYRYSGVTKVKLNAIDGTQSNVRISAHSLLSGVRFKF